MADQERKDKKLFRQEALERLSSPEQLDQLVEVVSPKAWLPLASLSFLVLTAATWSIFGRLPLNVKGQGVIVRPRRVVQFQAPSSGTLVAWQINPGDTIKQGEIIGIIDQVRVQQQLEQQEQKLHDLLAQTDETADIKRQQIALRREILDQKRDILEDTLRNGQALSPILRDKGLIAIEENREALELRLSQSRALLPELEDRVEKRRVLVDEGALSADSLLQTTQEYFDSLGQIADLETQLRQLDSKEAETQMQFLQNESQIRETRTQLQDLATEETKLRQEELELSFNQDNQLEEVRRKIDQLELQLATEGEIISPYDGRMLEMAASPGQVISTGTMLGAIQVEDQSEKLVGLAFLADRDGKQIKPGMSAQITPSIVKRERFGGIEGTVLEVSPFPITSQTVASMVGNPEFAKQLVGESAPVQIMIQMEEDDGTASGYSWSSSVGPNEEISSGTSASIQIRIGSIAPIAYVIPLFRSWTGIY